MPSAVDVSGTIALVAVGLLTLNLLLGLLLAAGYNPRRQWPRQAFKLFTLHNWTAYVAFTAVVLHAGALLFSADPPFRLFDVLVPIHSPVQPFSNGLGAIGFYLVTIVVVTSWKPVRTALGRHLWKPIHYTTYAAAFVFFIHGVIADPQVKNRPVDFLDAEKVYVEACAALVMIGVVWRVQHRRAIRRAARS
jgi:DMSO/TMAO reductase YedYZ heme-binding membrane subunit